MDSEIYLVFLRLRSFRHYRVHFYAFLDNLCRSNCIFRITMHGIQHYHNTDSKFLKKYTNKLAHVFR